MPSSHTAPERDKLVCSEEQRMSTRRRWTHLLSALGLIGAAACGSGSEVPSPGSAPDGGADPPGDFSRTDGGDDLHAKAEALSRARRISTARSWTG